MRPGYDLGSDLGCDLGCNQGGNTWHVDLAALRFHHHSSKQRSAQESPDHEILTICNYVTFCNKGSKSGVRMHRWGSLDFHLVTEAPVSDSNRLYKRQAERRRPVEGHPGNDNQINIKHSKTSLRFRPDKISQVVYMVGSSNNDQVSCAVPSVGSGWHTCNQFPIE